MIKYFPHEMDTEIASCPYPARTEETINKYCIANNLKIVSISCFSNKGVYVAFEVRK